MDKIIASIFNFPVQVLNACEGPSLGATILSKSGSENVPIESIISNLNLKPKLVLPDKDLKEIYEKNMIIGNKLIQILNKLQKYE